MNQFKVERLSWDSDFFGYDVFRILIENNQAPVSLNKIREQLTTQGLYYIYSDVVLNNDSSAFQDEKVVFKIILSPQQPEMRAFIRSVHSNDFEQLFPLALASGAYSRFRLDPGFVKNEFDQLYRTWLVKSLDRTLADEVLVWEADQKIAGFVTLKKKADHVEIGLIATHAQARGKGIGSTLLKASYHYAVSQHLPAIVVPTQRRNQEAIRFYLKNGFTEMQHTYIYHLWN